MKFSELWLKYNLSLKTQIENENWHLIIQILKDSPNIFNSMIPDIEHQFQVKNYEPLREEKQPPERPDAPPRRTNLNFPFIFVLTVETLSPSSLSIHFKEYLHSRLISHVSNLTDEDLYLLVKVLGGQIIHANENEIGNDFRLAKKLVEHFPHLMKSYFPALMEKQWYALAYKLVQNSIEILLEHQIYVKILFDNVVLNPREMNRFRQFLETKNHQILSIFNESRIGKKAEFMNRIQDYKNNLVSLENFASQFYRDEVTANIDLFLDLELHNIVATLLASNRKHKYRDPLSDWLNITFIEIGWSGKRQIFSGFIEKLIKLGYHQVVREFFQEFPDKIQEYPPELLLRLDSFLLELLQHHISDFKIPDPVSFFEKVIKIGYIKQVIDIFFAHFSTHKAEFVKTIKLYVDRYDLKQFIFKKRGVYEVLDILFGLQPYTITPLDLFDFSFIQEKLSALLSNEENCQHFAPISSAFLVLNFDRFNDSLKQKLKIFLLAPRHFIFLYSFANINPESFLLNFEDFFAIELQNDSDHGWYLGILKTLVIKKFYDSTLLKKVKDRLQDFPPSPIRGQILSYLGEHELACQNFYSLLERSRPFSETILNFLDFLIEFTETRLDKVNSSEIDNQIVDLAIIQQEFEKYNIREEMVQKFKFRARFFLGRLRFLWGQNCFNIYAFDDARKQFYESSKIFEEMKNYSRIPESVRKELEFNFAIANWFLTFIQSFISLHNTNTDLLQEIWNRNILQLKNQYALESLKIIRFIEQLEKYSFRSNAQNLLLQFAQPASFCPRGSSMLIKKLIDSANKKILFEWNRENQPIFPFEVFLINNVYETYELVLESSGEIYAPNYSLEFLDKPSWIEIDVRRRQFEGSNINLNEVCFEINLIAKPFSGQKVLKMQVRELELCGLPLTLTLPVVHRRITGEIRTTNPDLDFSIHTQFTSTGFYNNFSQLLPAAQVWIELINFFGKLLDRSSSTKEIVREPAMGWKGETRMNSFFGDLLKQEFHTRARNHSDVTDLGNADHWVDNEPIEDKLIRISKKSQTFNDFFLSHINDHIGQIQREAIHVGFGVLIFVDRRKCLLNRTENPAPIPQCVIVQKRDGYWIASFIFQIFTGTPSTK